MAPGFASGTTERNGAAFRPDGAMIQDQEPDPRRVLQRIGGGQAFVPLRTPQNGSGGVKTGYGGEAPMQAPPVQPGGRMFAPDGRHAAPEPPRLADLPHDQRQRTGGEAPSSTAPHDDRRPDHRGPRKYRPHASHAPGTSTRPGARQAPPRPRRPPPPGARPRRRRPGTAKRMAQH